MITVGPMSLHQPETLDPMEPYFTGTQADGGLHTDMARLSSHDHSGGLLGAPVAVTIPDGSITAADLDPSVLAPYALTDGSKPFTGEVTLAGDAVVRDALRFGEQGTALPPDATLTRTAAGVLALGAALAASGSATPRLGIGPTGTLTLAPDSGAIALQSQTALTLVGLGGDLTLSTGAGSGGNVLFSPAATLVAPVTDNTTNLGAPSNRWFQVYSNIGTINTSQAQVKEAWTPMDPDAALEACRNVQWFHFTYLPPAYTAPEPSSDIAYDASDDNETKAEKKAKRDEAEAQAEGAYARMLVETAPAREQRSYIFPDAEAREGEAPLPPVPELFGLSDRKSASPGSDVATLGAALQAIIRRLEAVEAAQP